MTKLEELNISRARAYAMVRGIGMMNTPSDYSERLASDAQYRLAHDAWIRAEREYSAELRDTSTETLRALAASAPRTPRPAL